MVESLVREVRDVCSVGFPARTKPAATGSRPLRCSVPYDLAQSDIGAPRSVLLQFHERRMHIILRKFSPIRSA